MCVCVCLHVVLIRSVIYRNKGFPGGSDGKESTCSAGDLGLISGSGRSPGTENDYPFQDSCLEVSLDRGVWWVAVHGVAESDPTK